MKEAPDFLQLQNLAAKEMGAEILYCTDQFYAPAMNMLQSTPVNETEEDGWVSRRRRMGGHDYCIIRLAQPGFLRGLEIDTTGFLGNFPPYASVEACCLPMDASLATIENHDDWENIVKKVALKPNDKLYLDMYTDYTFTHLRFHIYPDGGIARFKAYGSVRPESDYYRYKEVLDLAASDQGGKTLLCSDMHYGAMDNLLKPTKAADAKDAWVTQRNRAYGGCDWVVVELAKEGIIHQAIVDTTHLEGNYPERFTLEGVKLPQGTKITKENIKDLPWTEIVDDQKLEANKENLVKELDDEETFTHVRLKIYPDGGVSRLRLLGTTID